MAGDGIVTERKFKEMFLGCPDCRFAGDKVTIYGKPDGGLQTLSLDIYPYTLRGVCVVYEDHFTFECRAGKPKIQAMKFRKV
jgi:hypothetical protein